MPYVDGQACRTWCPIFRNGTDDTSGAAYLKTCMQQCGRPYFYHVNVTITSGIGEDAVQEQAQECVGQCPAEK